MSNVNFYTNEAMAKNKLFLAINYDDMQYDFDDEFIMNRFSPHPEERRLSFMSNGTDSNNYYSELLLQQENIDTEVFSDLFSKFKKYWGNILEENKDFTDLIELKCNFYRNAGSEFVSLAHRTLEEIHKLLADQDWYDQWAEDLFNWFEDELVEYSFNNLDLRKWKSDDDFDIKDGLVEIEKFLKQCINIITNTNDDSEFEGKKGVDLIVRYLDDLAEFFSYQMQYSSEFSKVFINYAEIAEASGQAITGLWVSNPNITFVALYEHSGICLQWGGGSCQFDSTGNAVIIIAGTDEVKKSIFNQVDNYLRGNIWQATQYQYVSAEDLPFYDEDLIGKLSYFIDGIDASERTYLIKNLGIETTADFLNMNVIQIASIGGFNCDYNEWENIASSFETTGIDKRKVSVTMNEIYEYKVDMVINGFAVPDSIKLVNYADGARITGTDRTAIKKFINRVLESTK